MAPSVHRLPSISHSVASCLQVASRAQVKTYTFTWKPAVCSFCRFIYTADIRFLLSNSANLLNWNVREPLQFDKSTQVDLDRSRSTSVSKSVSALQTEASLVKWLRYLFLLWRGSVFERKGQGEKKCIVHSTLLNQQISVLAEAINFAPISVININVEWTVIE